jgi:hypothetical protein
MTKPIIHGNEKFIRRQIERAREIAEHYHALNDPDSAWVFEYWASDAEFELDAKEMRDEPQRVE